MAVVPFRLVQQPLASTRPGQRYVNSHTRTQGRTLAMQLAAAMQLHVASPLTTVRAGTGRSLGILYGAVRKGLEAQKRSVISTPG